jgi:transcription elongation factor GreB
MSRAFVKDDDDRPEPALKRIAGEQPNYVTPAGLARLRESLERARADADARNVEYFEERVDSAIVVDPRKGETGVVAVGSGVTTRDERGSAMTLRIVGEDEADPARGSIGWTSPVAQALLGHRAGDRVSVRRPAGLTTLTIEAVDIHASDA